MAVLWFGPFYVVVMWTVVSSFMGSTWSDRNSYGDYLDNAEITTGQGMKDQNQLRKTSTRRQNPYKEDGRYIYDRVSKESRNLNSDPGVLLTDFWDSRIPSDSIYRAKVNTDTDLNQETWFNPNVEIFENSGTGPKMQQNTETDEMGGNGLVRIGGLPLKKAVGVKRQSHSLSIVNPLDVLRQRLMLEMARRRMKENQEQIKANDVILKNIGKRKKRALVEGAETKREKAPMRKRRQSDHYFDWPQNPALGSPAV